MACHILRISRSSSTADESSLVFSEKKYTRVGASKCFHMVHRKTCGVSISSSEISEPYAMYHVHVGDDRTVTSQELGERKGQREAERKPLETIGIGKANLWRIKAWVMMPKDIVKGASGGSGFSVQLLPVTRYIH